MVQYLYFCFELVIRKRKVGDQITYVFFVNALPDFIFHYIYFQIILMNAKESNEIEVVIKRQLMFLLKDINFCRHMAIKDKVYKTDNGQMDVLVKTPDGGYKS